MRGDRRLRRALFLVAVLALGWAGLRWFERAYIYFPAREFTAVPATFGLAHEELALRASDGVKLHGWFIPEAPGNGAAARGPLAERGLVLLYCHGNAGNVSGRVHKAEVFHRLGLGVLLFDYRGYGRSAGSPSEEGTYRDAQAAWQYLAEVKRLPPEKVVIYGESLGCGVALETALRHPPGALILESAFTSIADMGHELFPWLPVRWLARTRYDNLAKIPRIRAPVLVMHSSEDRLVPFRMGRALFAAAPQPKEFFEMKGDHNEGYIETGDAYPMRVRAFLERHTP